MPFLTPGDPVPWFQARSAGNPRYEFNTVAGRTIVLCLFGSTRPPGVLEVLKLFGTRTDLFNDERAAFFGVSCDPGDEAEKRVNEHIPGFRQFWDLDFKISAALGACAAPGENQATKLRYAPVTYVLDRQLRVVAALPLNTSDAANTQAHADRIAKLVESLSRPGPVGLNAHDAPL